MNSIPDEPAYPHSTFVLPPEATEAEMKELWDLENMLMTARMQVIRFRSCVALVHDGFAKSHELMNQEPPDDHRGAYHDPLETIYREWPYIAAHGAIGTLFHFAEVLASLSGTATKYLDPTAAKSASELFNKHFPKWEVTRHATAHWAEINMNAEANWFKGGLSRGSIRVPKGSATLIQDHFEDCTFITTRRGELLRFDVTWDNYLRFKSVYDLLLAGMRPAPR